MSEIKWTLFSEKDPHFPRVYITDFNSVWTAFNSEDYKICKDKLTLAWAEIPIPEVPVKKKELHDHYGNNGLTHVVERENGELWVSCINVLNPASYFHCSHCPFCGFKPEKEES